MGNFFTSAQRPWLFGVGSLALTLVTTAWFAISFTAREKAWWNAGFWFPLFYGAAAVLALRGIRSILGMVALLLALLPLVLISIMLFSR
ncbi:MAG TPA: hypothetical protein VEP30_05480 [Chthoniobacterales bacterium]|nr:hypothetical protein [Chthoniobacterales bacterium]